MASVSVKGPGRVDREAVYHEFYNESRRYRDYELISSSWYTGFLLAILGFLVATRFSGKPEMLWPLIAESWWPKATISIGSAMIAVTSNFLVWYSYSRYKEIRAYLTEKLEPGWRKFTPRSRWLSPRDIYIWTPRVVVVFIILTAVL